MRSLTSKLLWLVSVVFSCCWLAAQPAPMLPGVVVLPTANTIMLTQTVQTVFLTVTNYESFTNLTSMMRVVTNTIQLLDDGIPPDVNASDGVYSGSFVVPAFAAPTNFVALFTTSGQDLSITNDMGELLPESWATNITRVTYRAVVRPANDNFANAIKIPPGGGTVTGSNEFATIEPAEPFHAGNPQVAASIWWTWSPTNNTSVLIDTAGSGFEPVLAVYTGASLDVLRPVAVSTNDVEHGLKAYVVFDGLVGVTYRIAVAGYTDADVGLVRLRVVPGGLPDIVPPEVEIVEPADTVLTNAAVRIAGVALDPMPHGTGVSSVTLQLNDGPPSLATGTTNWNLGLTLSPGTNVVSVVAEDVAGNRSEPVLLILYYSAVPNDDFAGALELSGFSGSVTVTNDLATREADEPMHANNEGGHSVWYWFRAPATGLLRLTTQGSSIDTLLAVYEGRSLSELLLVAANDDANPGSGYSELTATLARDRVYYIAIDGFGGSTGKLVLEYEFEPTEIMRTLNVIAGPGGSAVPAPGLFPQGSIQVVTALPERGFVFTGWQGTVNATRNPLVVVMDRDHALTASFRVVECTEGFESGGFGNGFAWASNGNAAWVVASTEVYNGRFAAQSGRISNGEQSSLILEATLRDGTGAFWVKVSSENQWDGLEFYLNGLFQKRWTGETGWELYQFRVVGGVNTLEWRYSKDANFSAGADAGFIDNLYLPLADEPIVPVLSMARVPDETVQLAIQGFPSRIYIIENSMDLVHWTGIMTNSSPSGSWVWRNYNPTGARFEFYRARER